MHFPRSLSTGRIDLDERTISAQCSICRAIGFTQLRVNPPASQPDWSSVSQSLWTVPSGAARAAGVGRARFTVLRVAFHSITLGVSVPLVMRVHTQRPSRINSVRTRPFFPSLGWFRDERELRSGERLNLSKSASEMLPFSTYRIQPM